MREKADFSNTAPRKCKGCEAGKVFRKGFTTVDGKTTYPDETRDCTSCNATGTFNAPNYVSLVTACISTKGKNKGTLRASPPCDPWRNRSVDNERSYYIWRMARFHGGKDVTMPMTAGLITRHDPFIAELDVVAEWLAKKCFGTDLAGAFRWASALGYVNKVPEGLPASAYNGGPVADGNKPPWERAELGNDSED